ncbi:uncharacterized protein LOC115217644 isoform X2 [Octopus sinensis]|uniref:Uncharacterized protein LOC115217644 isoform X2 n=1 Tax=Octopus sinensis TaxID=2607531 RepID=A0A6P7SYM1_9MOLL|nr:uncharacterized protein LOC115217644 isoform X2 [Octopus sinensis]
MCKEHCSYSCSQNVQNGIVFVRKQHTFEDKSRHDQANLQFFTSDQRQRKENNKDSDNEEKKNNCKQIQFDSKEKILEENKVTKVLLKDLIKDTKTDSETSPEMFEEIQKENFENNSDKKAGVSPICEEKINDTKVTVIAESFVKDKILDQAKPTVQRSKITIKLTGKTGIKPLQYPVLSPWMSTSKMPGPNKAQSAKVSSDKKMWSTKEVESQLSLDDFLTCSNNHGSDPVASDIEIDEEKTNIKISNLSTCRQSADTSILQESIDDSENKKSQEFLPDSHMSTTMPVSVSQVSGSCLLPIGVLATTPFPPSPPESTCRNSSNVFEGTDSSDLCISLAVDQKSSNVHESDKESETKVISESKNGARTLLSQHKGTIQLPVSTGAKFFTRDLDKRLLGVDSTSQVSMGKIHHSPPSVFQITETNDASLYQTDKENITLHSSVTLEGNPSNGSPPVIQETSLLVNKENFPKICSNNVSDPLASSTSTLFDEINSKSCYSISALHSELSSVPSKLQLSDNFELPRKYSAMETAPSNLSAINTGEIKSDHSAVSSKSDAKSNFMENKDSLVTLLSNSTRSDMRTVDSSTVEQNISLIPLPTSMSSSLANIWDIPLPSNLQSECQPPTHGVLIRESEHNYAIRLMENSDGVLHPVKRAPLQHDDKNVDSDDSNNDISNNSWKAQSFVAQAYLSHSQSDDEGETSQLSISSENDSNNSLPQQCSQSSESNDTISPPVLEAEGRQSCLIPNEDLSNNDSPPPLTAEVPCLSPSVSLPCSTSSVIPVTLVCNPPCESKTLFTTPNTLSIDNTSLLNNMSILNLDSVIRSQANSINHTSKTYSSNDRNVKSIKKVVLLKKPVQNIPSRHLRTSRKSQSKQNDVKLLKVDKVDQEKIIVKVTSRTSEGVPVISLTPATSTASYTTSGLSSSSVATTSSSGSNFTEISETETADSSLLEAAAKKAETLPKMFMPTVVLHDIKYTMGKDLSPMATIPSSIENIPIFDSENDDSDSDVKFESPKKSFESQRQLEIESPSKTLETFDPYMFLNRPTKPSIPSSSYNTQLTNESSTLFSIGPCGTSATGRVTADSLPSIDNQSMISNMFDVTDCKFAFPDVFLENGEPETPPKISNVDVLGPGLPFETSSKSNIALGLDILNEFYTAEGTEDSG